MKNGTTRCVLLLTVLLAVTARTVQLMYFYDAESGFTTDGGWLSGIVLGLGALSVFLPFLRSENANMTLATRRRLVCGLGGLLGGVSLLEGTVLALLDGVPQKASLTFSALTRGTYAACLVLTAMTGIALLYLSLCHFVGWRPYAHTGWLSLIPVLAVAARALYLFAVYTPEDSSMVNLLNLSALGLQLGFFASLGRCFAEGEPTISLRALLLYGTGAGAVGLAASVPHLLCAALGLPCVQSADLPFLLGAAGLSLYAFSVALSISKKREFAYRRHMKTAAAAKVDDFAQDLTENN